MTHKEFQGLMNECDMLEGNINRMIITTDKKELRQMYRWAERRLQKIYKTRFAELDKEDPCCRCDYFGESCVGEGCGKLTERKNSEAK